MTSAYDLTSDAAADLEGIWKTSFDRWGPDQADRYLAQIEDCLAQICAGEAVCTELPEVDLRLKSHHCQHHYIFFLDGNKNMTVIAVLFERMDLLVRLKRRLR